MIRSPGSWLTHLCPSLCHLEQSDVLLQSTSSLDSVRRQTLIVFRKNRVRRDCHWSNRTMLAEKSRPDSPADFQTHVGCMCGATLSMYYSDLDVCSYTFTVYKLGLFLKAAFQKSPTSLLSEWKWTVMKCKSAIFILSLSPAAEP